VKCAEPEIEMTLALTTADFQLRQTTCEVRYQDSFLIFDRTGSIYQELGKKFTNLHADSAAPAQTQMTSDQGTAVIEIKGLRLSDNDPKDAKLEKFSENFKLFFDIAAEKLNLAVFTRVGLRLIYIKTYESFESSKGALNSIRLHNLGSEKRFGAGPDLSEIILRWENEQLGAVVRIKAEKGTIDAKFPPDLGLKEKAIKKDYYHLILDVDYYTVAPVEREQWDPATWIGQSARIVRKEVDRIISL
jgi:hypothetical protein